MNLQLYITVQKMKEECEKFLNTVQWGTVEKVIQYINAGVDVNYQGNNGWTALHVATRHNNKKKVQILIENDADLNIQNDDGCTALHLATIFKYDSIIQMLSGNGAKVNIQDKNGQTALYLASKEGHESIVSILLATKGIQGDYYRMYFQKCPIRLIFYNTNFMDSIGSTNAQLLTTFNDSQFWSHYFPMDKFYKGLV